MSWEYELAKEFRRPAQSGPPSILEGTVVSTAPLTVSLCDGEVMPPPKPL